MKLLGIVALASAATVGAAAAQPYGGGQGRGPVAAQPYGGGQGRGPVAATLYELPNFQGRQTVVYGHEENLPRAFNDLTRSAKFQGRWRICEDSDYRGRCIDVQGDVADLNSLGFAERISSLQSYSDIADEDDRDDRNDRDNRDDRGGPGYGGGYGGSYAGNSGGYNNTDRDRRGVDGARNVFFAYPNSRGADIPANAGAADRFCRANGFGSASYFDSDYRSSRSQDDGGRYASSGPVLRDVLCRR